MHFGTIISRKLDPVRNYWRIMPPGEAATHLLFRPPGCQHAKPALTSSRLEPLAGELLHPEPTMTKPYVSISVITPKPDRFEEFMELQLAQHHRVRGQVQGLRGGRLFRSLDGRGVVLVTAFETVED